MDWELFGKVLELIGSGGLQLIILTIIFGSVLVLVLSITAIVILWRSGYILKVINIFDGLKDQLQEDNKLKERMIKIIEEKDHERNNTHDQE